MRAVLRRLKRLATIVTVLLVFSAVARHGVRADGQGYSEYLRYVHTYVNSTSLCNWTYVEKPVFPVFLNESQVAVGQNWSIVCPLRANHSYHVYCYGDWVDDGAEPETDYDVYMYDPSGELTSYHTEAAGLPEHLGSTVTEPFLRPAFSGNYTFVVRNDPRESNGTQKATFMIIENVQCNVWHEHYVEGKDGRSMQVFNTGWAYEFVTSSQHVEAYVRVPDSLDMYEARLYLMAYPASGMGIMLNGVPLAWEDGLYGKRKESYGGYNLESQMNRGVAYASCEQYGQDMLLNFTTTSKGMSLYHLVLIGEAGAGAIRFLVKTEFDKAALKPLTAPFRGHPHNETAVAYRSNMTDLVNATLWFSTDDWGNSTALDMEVVDNRTCRAVIPGQDAGLAVAYRVEADDVLENRLRANGTYAIKFPLSLNITLPRKTATIGDNVTVKGYVSPGFGSLPVTVTFSSENQSRVVAYTFENGTFVASCRLDMLGPWDVQAAFAEDGRHFGCVSGTLTVKVEEPSLLVKYSLYIGGGLGTAAAVGVVVYVKKFRE